MLCTIFTLGIHFAIFSQEFNVVGGVSNGEISLEFADVFLTNLEGEIVSGGVTNEEGNFEFNTKEGDYTLNVSFIGYLPFAKEVSIKMDTDFGIILLEGEENRLEEVEVVYKKPTIQRQIDRLIFNVENTLLGLSGNVLDILKKTPRVRVQNDDIRLIGKSSLRIMINDRLVNISNSEVGDLLKSLSADNVLRIEVIPNPPAKYEAAGNSGLINIILKKAKNDFLGGNFRSSYRKNTFSTGEVSGALSYKKNRLSSNLNLSGTDGMLNVEEIQKIYYSQETWNSESITQYFNKRFSLRTGIDYDLTNKTSLGLQYLPSASSFDSDSRTRINIKDRQDELNSYILSEGQRERNRNYHSYNFLVVTNLDSLGKKILFDVDYLETKFRRGITNENNSYLPNDNFIENSSFGIKSKTKLDSNILTSRIDVEWPTKVLKINFGGKLTYIKNHSNFMNFGFKETSITEDSNQLDVFEYDENTQALYTSLSKTFDKWEFKAGLRLETTNTKGNSISLNQINENNYSKLFPSSYLAFFPNDNNNFTISYGKRVNRPNFSLLNPFRVIYNSFYVSEGNPFLRPSFSDNIEFAHTFKDNLDSTFFVSFIDNGFGELSKLNNSNQIQQSVWENFLNEFSYGVSQSYYFDFWQWLESFLRYDLSYVEVSSSLPNTTQKRKGVNFDFSVDNTIYFNSDKTFLGQINFWYVSPGVWDNEFYTSSYAIDLGLRWILFDKKVEINFLASDLLKTDKPTYRTTYADIRSEYTSYFDVRFFRLTAIYKFGKTTTQKKRFGNSQESSRIDSN